MKNFSVQYLLSHTDNKNKDVSTSNSETPLATTTNALTLNDLGRRQHFRFYENWVFFFKLEDDNHSSVSSSIYESSNDDDDDDDDEQQQQQTTNPNPVDSGTASEDSETAKYLQREHVHRHETSKRRKRRVLFTKQQTYELERRFRQQRYLSGKYLVSNLNIIHFIFSSTWTRTFSKCDKSVSHTG